MKGRKPLPTNLKLVTGTSRPDRENPREPQVPVAAPPPPDYLEADEAAVFSETAELLARMRVMTEADVDALAMYAVSFTRWQEATRRVREGGMVVVSEKKTPMQNPYLGVANVAQRDCVKIMAEFGLTPSSRTRVQVT